MKKTLLSLILLSVLTWSCNNSKKEEKTDVTDSTHKVMPMPMPADSMHTGDSMSKGEQVPPPKTN